MAINPVTGQEEDNKQPSISSGWSIGASGPRLSSMSLPKATIDAGINTMRSQMAAPKADNGDGSQVGLNARLAAMQRANGVPDQPIAALPDAATGKPPTPLSSMRARPIDTSSGPTVSDSAGGVYTPEKGFNPLSAGINFFKDSAQAARTGVDYAKVKQDREAAAQASAAPGSEAQVVPVGTAPAAPASISAPSLSGMATGPSIGSSYNQATGIASWKDPAFRPLSANIGDGIGAISINSGKNAGKNMVVTPAAAQNTANTYDGIADLRSLSNMNAIRQSMIDNAIDRGSIGSGVLEDSRVAESNARLDESGRQMALERALRQPGLRRAKLMSEQAIATINADTQRRGQDLSYDTALSGQGVMARGQDLSADTTQRGQDLHMQQTIAQLNGNPLDQKLKQYQIDGQQQIADLRSTIADPKASTEQRAAAYKSLLALNMKDPQEQYTFHTIGGGVDPVTNAARPQGLVVANKNTGGYKIVQQDDGQANSIPAPDKRVIGQAYNTPKGKMIWRGNGWEPQA